MPLDIALKAKSETCVISCSGVGIEELNLFERMLKMLLLKI